MPGECGIGWTRTNDDGTNTSLVKVNVGSMQSDHANYLAGLLESEYVGSFASSLGRITSARLAKVQPTGPSTFEFNLEFEVTYRTAPPTV